MRISPSKRAQEILTELDIKQPTIDVEDISTRSGIRVIKEELPPTISGMLQREPGKNIIYVNKDQHPNRQRFTIAHELGHFFLNHTQGVHVDKVVKHFRDEESSLATSPIEIDANRFAAELLMPETMVRNYVKAHSQTEPDEEKFVKKLADRFVVSSIAMTLRLQNLGIKLSGY